MRKVLVAVLTTVFVLGFGYAANAIHETMVDGMKVVLPGADAAKLYNYITQPKPYYNRWKLWPGKSEFAQGKGSHGSFMTTYVNEVALGSLKKGKKMADGAVIVTENYNAQKKLESLTVIYKIEGFNAQAGDWFWARYAPPNGYVLESGKIDSCIACHEKKQDQDYLY